MKKTYKITHSEYGDTLWDNDYGQKDAEKIIKELNLSSEDELEIEIDEYIIDVILSYVEGFYTKFLEHLGDDFWRNNVTIKSTHSRVLLRFSKYMSKKL